MAQKVNPFGFRVGITQKHRSSWCVKNSQYRQRLQSTELLKQILRQELKGQQISKLFIEYEKKKKCLFAQIYIHTPAAKNFFGRTKEQRIAKLTNLKALLKAKTNISCYIELVPSVGSLSAKIVAEAMGQELENRAKFRFVMKQAIRNVKAASVQGVKVQISGRLNGAEMARTEWIREGRIPLQTLDANIDYHHHEAKTKYGILGIKVWIFQEK